MFPATTRRVIENTRQEINEQIARQAEARVAKYIGAPSSVIDDRLAQLDKEWDIERFLETNASALTLLGLLLAITSSWYWLIIPIAVPSLLLLHGLQGWCPPVPLLRRLGVRTETEISHERYALKTLRKDFEGLPKPEGDNLAQAVELLEAARR